MKRASSQQANDDTSWFIAPKNRASREAESDTARESIRRNFLRANTAVAIILLAVFSLALVAVVASLQATRQQRVAEQAQDAARNELWRTYVSKARAARLGSALDRRSETLQAIASAASIKPSAELRSEAIAALALTDFALERSWPLSDEIVAEAFDRNLDQYAIGSTNGDIAVRRVSDNQLIQSLRQTDGEIPSAQGAPLGIEFSPNAKQLAVRYERGGVVVWDIASGKPIFRHALDQSRAPASRPRFTSDGRFLICMTAVPAGGVGIFDLVTGEIVAHFPQFPSWMHAAPRPGTTMFSVTTETNTVHVLDWRTGQTVISLPFPAGVERMTWSPDGRYLAIGGRIVDAHLWDFEAALAHGPLGQRRVLTGHTADVRNLVFDPTGQWLASASSDGTSRIWETRTGRLVGVTDAGFAQQFGKDRLALTHFRVAAEVWSFRPSPIHSMNAGPGDAENFPWAMDLSPDGRWLASLLLDRGLVLWDLDNGTTPGWFEITNVRMLTFHPSEPELFVAKSNDVTVRKLTFDSNGVAQPRLGEPRFFSLPAKFSPQWIALSRNAQTMALGSYFGEQTFITDLTASNKFTLLKGLRHLTRFDVESPTASATGGGSLALSRDGRWAACGFVYPRGAKVWDTRSGEAVATLCADNAVVQFSPDDRWLLAGNRSHFQLFRASEPDGRGSWQELWRIPREGVFYSVGPCAFSPDGQQLAVAKSRQTAAILDAKTGQERAQLIAPRSATIKAIRWSPDGRRLVMATAENLIQVWDLNALRSELTALSLNWDRPGGIGLGSIPPIRASGHSASIASALILGLFAAGIVTLVALAALRRHRKLIEDFAQTEALADQHKRELQIERDVGQLKSSFVSLVSHEFRTPLGVITASAENLKRYFVRLSEEQREQLLGDITNSSSRMRDLIEEVLLLGKVESGKMKCQLSPVDVPALCRRTIAEVTAASGGVARIDLSVENLDGDARLDETLTGIILTNLLNNAVKYSPAGSPVSLSIRRNANDVIIEVCDQGIGIPMADQKQLFKSFHRAVNVGNAPGTGLGLTIVKRCIDLHDGWISFISAEHKGTTFIVCLPAFAA